MIDRALSIIAKLTIGKIYNINKFCYNDEHSIAFHSSSEEQIPFSTRNLGEEIDYTNPIDLRSRMKKEFLRDGESLFKYFVDGSRKTYKLTSIEYEKSIYPIIAGQVGVACCERNKRILKCKRLNRYNVIALPNIAIVSLIDDCKDKRTAIEYLRTQINNSSTLKKQNIVINKVLLYNQDLHLQKDIPYENLGISKIHEFMLDEEKRMINILVNDDGLRYVDNYLIKDGSIEYIDSKNGDFNDFSLLLNNYKRVIGVSKTFNPDFLKDNRKKTQASLIADLPLYHRTPSYKYESKRSKGAKGPVFFITWYIRIREKTYNHNPFDGIVKIEKVVPEDGENYLMDSEEIDMISANIINERLPTTYGIEDRWPNHLYPVHLTERLLKNTFISDDYFMNIF
ncbi:hypothetical protein [Sediminispirochaeta smaragdinae]|uniref:NurA domain-containing protein n=1 Tax=Sediminispirochaeta smaragdinae (strain DSM 11293 / JCM 15392 / SEBR 4228) TaxID=573413 RepID=E1R1E8_SEDSS|nr:hypothetical protein [Sediminispirochaeta smaragdinae]ADK81089.1 conserved hypothetical protein [Sediminispirochaeta smaragdinae DSM 11293]